MNSNDELRDLWQQQPAAPVRKGEDMLTLVIERTRKLDRQIAGRNTREVCGALFVAIVFAVMAWNAQGEIERLGWAITAASGIWIAYYILRFGAGPGRVDREASVASYTAVLAEGYERQIRLLKTVKYWYILPQWIGVTVAMLGSWVRLGGSAMAAIGPALGWAFASAVCVAVWMLNERYGVRCLVRLKAELPRND